MRAPSAPTTRTALPPASFRFVPCRIRDREGHRGPLRAAEHVDPEAAVANVGLPKDVLGFEPFTLPLPQLPALLGPGLADESDRFLERLSHDQADHPDAG